MELNKIITLSKIAHYSNYGGLRTNSEIRYIVIHYTGNDGDIASNNLNYFTSPNRKASAHLFVDDINIALSVPLERIAYHCGGTKYNDTQKTGGGTLYKIVTNRNSIGIEMCDTERNGEYNLTQQTRQNTIKVVRVLMKYYNIPITNVVRHFDVTGKYCPSYFMDSKKWNEFKAEIVSEPAESTPTPSTPTPSTPTEPTDKIIWDKLYQHFQNPYGVAGLIGNLQAESSLNPINLQNSYNKKFNLTDEEYTEQVDTNQYTNFIHDLAGFGLAQWTFWSRKEKLYNYMKARNLSIGDLNGQIEFLIEELKGYKNVYNTLKTATSVKQASDIVLTQYERPADQSDKMKEKRTSYGQVFFNKYAKPQSFRVKVKASHLNIRKGPSTAYQKVGAIRDHGVYTIVGTNETGTWGKLKSGLGYISLSSQYVTRL